MAIVIEALNEVYSLENNKNLKLFLAGGITNCPDWQAELIEKIKDLPGLTVYNPRRKNFPIDDPNASEAQIIWEYEKLRDADAILFWFSKGSLNPIVLYELGRWGNSDYRPIIVGIDPEYERKQDVLIQTLLARPDADVVVDLEEVVNAIEFLLEDDED